MAEHHDPHDPHDPHDGPHLLGGKVMHTPLGQLDRRLARLIRRCDDPHALRRFALACASHALAAARPEADPTVAAGLTLVSPVQPSTGSTDVAALERARAALAPRLAELDRAASAAQDAFDEGVGSHESYERAYARARAASSVAECLHLDAHEAAIGACWEAMQATGDVEALLALARQTLA